MSFGWMVIGGVGIGLAVAFIFLKVHKIFPTDVNMDIILSLAAPYVMYIAAEEVHSSGVMSVVSGGLFLSLRRHEWLKTPESRLKGFNVWESFTFLINGIVFLIIGLDLPEITTGLKNEGIEISDAIGYGLLITAILIIVRFIASYGAVITTLIMRNFIQVADPNPDRKAPLLFGWTGMRGVVSLAAALSIPVTLENGQPFPHRDLILFITFIVILVTLILQGLTLPALIKWLNIPVETPYHLPEKEASLVLQKGMKDVALSYLSENFKTDQDKNLYIKNMITRWEKEEDEDSIFTLSEEGKAIYFATMEKQREWLRKENRDNPLIDEEVTRDRKSVV